MGSTGVSPLGRQKPATCRGPGSRLRRSCVDSVAHLRASIIYQTQLCALRLAGTNDVLLIYACNKSGRGVRAVRG